MTVPLCRRQICCPMGAGLGVWKGGVVVVVGGGGGFRKAAAPSRCSPHPQRSTIKRSTIDATEAPAQLVDSDKTECPRVRQSQPLIHEEIENAAQLRGLLSANDRQPPVWC